MGASAIDSDPEIFEPEAQKAEGPFFAGLKALRADLAQKFGPPAPGETIEGAENKAHKLSVELNRAEARLLQLAIDAQLGPPPSAVKAPGQVPAAT